MPAAWRRFVSNCIISFGGILSDTMFLLMWVFHLYPLHFFSIDFGAILIPVFIIPCSNFFNYLFKDLTLRLWDLPLSFTNYTSTFPPFPGAVLDFNHILMVFFTNAFIGLFFISSKNVPANSCSFLFKHRFFCVRLGYVTKA